MKCFSIFLVIFMTTFIFSNATNIAEPISISRRLLVKFMNMTTTTVLQQAETHELKLQFTTPFIIAGCLSFAAASVSSAGGIGGGGLYIPILTIIAGLDLKSASSFSALMVTGGSIANVASNVFLVKKKVLIDYDVALLSEPCMLLGASIGVFCNIIFPEWLITGMFAIFLVWSTFKTFKFGIAFWKLESQGIHGCNKYLEDDGIKNDIIQSEEDGNPGSIEQPLLLMKQQVLNKVEVPWGKLGGLAMIWFSFFLLYLLRGGRYGQGIIHIQSCGVGYWIISAAQIPLAILSTSWIVFKKERICNQHQGLGCDMKKQGSDKLIFPVMAFLAGVLGGVFGIGGGMLISPLLLQVGISPGVTSATCSFMVFFSATMSAFQYILLGMEHIESAIIFAVVCFAGSVIGLVIVQRAIEKHGRASLIVFSVGLVLGLSTLLMTSFGAVDVWKDFNSGIYMGFKQPC